MSDTDVRAAKFLVGWLRESSQDERLLEVLTELHEAGAWSAAGLLDWCAECNGTGYDYCPECKGETHDTARGRA